MSKYIPFLKFKQNEIQALGKIDSHTTSRIRPFFDIPRTSKNQSDVEIKKRINLGIKHLSKLITEKGDFEFYIDNFDLDDDIELDGVSQYRNILGRFIEFNAIPVLALDRHIDHNSAAFDYLETIGGNAAVRLQLEDIESYSITQCKLIPLWQKFTQIGVDGIHLIIDFRYINNENIDAPAAQLIKFIKKFIAEFSVEKIIITGSTIPAIIGNLIPTDASINVYRREFILWKLVLANLNINKVLFGDYGVVSPDYADIDLDPRLFRRISTPKAFYPYDHMLFAVRGTSFQAHPAGNGQYFLIASSIEQQSFFRKGLYSYGDRYIFERSSKSVKKPNKAGSPGSWVKATLVSHITFVATQI